MSQTSLSILAFGISPNLVDAVNDRLLAQGIDAKSLAISNTASSDAEISRIASSKNWSGMLVGYGVRHDQQWFERVLRIVQQANPKIPLIDHRGPSDAEKAIERHFHVKLPLTTIQSSATVYDSR